MIDNESVLAVIVARGGSKGLPGKNIRLLAGKPMLAWSIEAGQASHCIDRLILSSDDAAIISTARSFGCEVPFVRPPHLALDDISVGPVLIHAIEALDRQYDWLALLQATSPMRLGSDIDGCLRLAKERQAPAALSVTPAAKPPHWMVWLDAADRMHRVVDPPEHGMTHARQLLPQAFVPNGSIYVARTEWFRGTGTFYTPETLAYVMPAERSIDVDSLMDFTLAEALLEASRGPDSPQPSNSTGSSGRGTRKRHEKAAS